MKNKLFDAFDKFLLGKRGIIESVGNVLKNVFRLEHSRHRSPKNFLAHIVTTVVAYCFKPTKPSIAAKVSALLPA
jgi:hypothetical protein